VVLNSVLQLKNLRKCSTGGNQDAWTLWEVIYGMKTVNFGEILENMGYKEAIECFDKALEIDPQYTDAWYNKGVILYMTKDFPNLSISSTCIYSLDVDGTCELYYITTYSNIDRDYEWSSSSHLIGPFLIIIKSFSDERPNVTSVIFDDVVAIYIDEWFAPELQNDQTYKHSGYIAFAPPNDFTFYEGSSVTIRMKIEINNASSEVNDYCKFPIIYQDLVPNTLAPIKNAENFVVRVNLPNDDYYWSEVLHTTPKYDYRTPFGRGESLEWLYGSTDRRTNNTTIDYRIHPDPLKQELDSVSRQSLDYSEKSLCISYIALSITIFLGGIAIRKDLKSCLMKAVQALQNHIHSAIDKRKNRRKNEK